MVLTKICVVAVGLMAAGCAATNETSAPGPLGDDAWAWDRAVEIEVSTPTEVARGSASWLAPDLVITSSHFFLGKPENVSVRVGKNGIWQEAKVEVADHPDSRDLAILRVTPDAAMQAPTLEPVKICTAPLVPAQEVIVVSAFKKSVGVSYGSPDYVTRHLGKSWTTSLTGYFPEGTSGGALYDRSAGCLAGVISMRQKSWSPSGPSIYTTRFVSAEEITNFIRENKISLPAVSQE